MGFRCRGVVQTTHIGRALAPFSSLPLFPFPLLPFHPLSSFPFLFLFSLSSPPFPLSLEAGPLLRLVSLESTLAPRAPRAEPGRQTVFGEFQAKNLASSINDLYGAFQEMKHQTGGLGGRVYRVMVID